MKKIWLFLAILLMANVSTASARTISLSWDTNSDADYYVVYWGTKSGVYTHESDPIDIPSTGYTTPDLSNETWYLAVKAFNVYGNSSDFSEEVSSTVTDNPNPEESDRDGDGICDADEISFGTDPDNPDTDGDGLTDEEEIYYYSSNPLNSDTNSDGVTDGLQSSDHDSDNDGVPDIVDLDVDGDGTSNTDEINAGTDPFTTPTTDSDGDGLSNALEISIGTNPNNSDTDGDGESDYAYYTYYDADYDADGIIDIIDTDDDNDGISDADEKVAGTNPKFNSEYWYVDGIDISNNLYFTRTDLSSQTPVVVKMVANDSGGFDETNKIYFSDTNHKVILIVGDLGNLDGQGGNEVAFLVRDNSTNLDSKIILDIQTGAIYTPEGTSKETTSDSGSDTSEETTETSYCDINIIDMDTLSDGKLVAVGFCTETNQTVVQTLTKNGDIYNITQEMNVLDEGIEALTIEVKDINGDGLEDIIVTPKMSENSRVIKTVTGVTVITSAK